MKNAKHIISVLCILVLLIGCGLFITNPVENLPARFEETFPVSRTDDNAWYPCLVWAGNKWGVLYQDISYNSYNLYFSCIYIDDSDSSYTISPENPGYIAEKVYSSGFDIAWNGTELGIIFSKYINGAYNLFFCRLDSKGLKIQDSEKQITNSTNPSHNPSMVWNAVSREYGITWQEKQGSTSDSDILFITLDEYGEKKEEPYVIIDTSLTAREARVLWNGSDYAFTWKDNSNNSTFAIYFKSGILDPEQEVENADTILNRPHIAFSGEEYGLVWYEEEESVKLAKFARLDLDGTVSGTIRSVGNRKGNPAYPCIAWDGDEYGIAWQETRDDEINRICFLQTLQLSPSDAEPTCFMTTTGNSQMPSLAWNGTYYAITWSHKESDGNHRIYFAF